MNEVLALQSLSPVTILDRTEFFDGLSRLHLEKVADICQLKRYYPPCDIYRHGDEAEELYVLVDGTVMFAVGFGERNASAGNTLRRGNVFGWAALTPTAPPALTVPELTVSQAEPPPTAVTSPFALTVATLLWLTDHCSASEGTKARLVPPSKAPVAPS